MGAIMEQFFVKMEQFESKTKKIAHVYALLGHLLIFSTWGMFKIVNKNGVSVAFVLYIRGLVGFILNYLVINVCKYEMYPRDKIAQKVLLIGFFIQMIFPILQFYGVSLLNVSDATVLAMTNPIWVQLISFVLYREQISRQHQINTLISFAGIVFICRPSFIFSSLANSNTSDDNFDGSQSPSNSHLIGCLSMIGGAGLLAASQTLFKALQGKTTSSIAMQYSYFSNIISTPIGLIHQETSGETIYAEPIYFALAVLIGVVAYLGQILQTRSLFIESPAKLAPLSYTRVVYSFVLDIFFFEITIHPLSFVGLSVLLLALLNILRSQ